MKKLYLPAFSLGIITLATIAALPSSAQGFSLGSNGPNFSFGNSNVGLSPGGVSVNGPGNTSGNVGFGGRGSFSTPGGNGTFGPNGGTFSTPTGTGTFGGNGATFNSPWVNAQVSRNGGFTVNSPFGSTGGNFSSSGYATPSMGASYGQGYSGGQGASGSAVASSGTSGDYGNDTDVTKGDRAQINDRSPHDYRRTTANQKPMSGGGLPRTVTAVEGIRTFGVQPVPSAQWKFGFPNLGPAPYLGPTFKNPRFTGPFPTPGAMLPQTSTASFDGNTVDCPFIRKP